MSRRLARFPQVRVHPGALAAKSDSPSLSPTRSSSNTFSTNSSGGAARPAGSRPGQSAGATSSNPLWPSVVRRTGTPQTPYGSGGAERARGLSGSNNKSGEDDDAHDAANLAELKIAGGSSSASSSRSSSPPTPDSVADLATAESDRNGNSSSSSYGSSTTTAPGSSSSNGGAQRVGTATALRRRTAAAAGSVGRSLVASVPKLKVVLDMDECLVHSIFQEHAIPGRVPFGRAKAPPPSPVPPPNDAPIESFHLVMLDKATCTVNKRPKVDWFLEECCARFDVWVMTAGTRDYAQPLLDVLDPNGMLKGRFYRDQCVFHDGHYFKDLSLVDEDPKRVVLVDNNPASFVLCPANGIPVPSFYDDPTDRGLEHALDVLVSISEDRDVRRTLRSLYGLEAKLGPLTRQFARGPLGSRM